MFTLNLLIGVLLFTPFNLSSFRKQVISSDSKVIESPYISRATNNYNVFENVTPPKRVNLNGEDIIPQITFPEIAQKDFKDAFNVLDECLVMEPGFGFNFPFISPGGHYGACWWQIDASLALNGAKWVNQHFSENVLRGFASVQKPDGRIPLYGYDEIPGYPICSSLPKLFGSAYAVLKHSNDNELIHTTYDYLKKYMDWWSDARRDNETGLITGVFEESFPPVENQLKRVAQVDLNVEIAAGCNILGKLAKHLGITSDYRKYSAMEEEIKAAINKYMWDESSGAYYSYRIKEKKLDSGLFCYAFDPFRLQIAPRERISAMVSMLTDDNYFNWDSNPITSAAKTDKSYNETVGTYNGAFAWSGDIWTLRNEVVIRGLEDIGRYDLAAYLSLRTVNLFNANYAEFIKPSDGTGHGEQRYAWSASQYIQILIENIFGIDYNSFNNTITIRPNLDGSLAGKDISLEKLLLPDGNRLSLYLSKKTESTTIRYQIDGENKEQRIVISLPTNGAIACKVANRSKKRVKLTKIKKGAALIYQIDNGKKYDDEFTFLFGSHK